MSMSDNEDIDKLLDSNDLSFVKTKKKRCENIDPNINFSIEKENNTSSNKNNNNLTPFLKSTIDDIENNLKIFNFPSFNFIYENLKESNLNSFIEKMNLILMITRQNRDKNMEYLNNMTKLLNENNNLKNKLEKYKNDNEKYKIQILNIKQDQYNEKVGLENKNNKLKNEINNLKNEITKNKSKEATILNQMKNDKNQYEEKRQSLIQTIEQLEKKIKDYDSIKSIPLQEYYLTYNLNGSNCNSKNISLTEELEMNLKNNYYHYYEDNEYLKKNICDLIQNMINLTKERKDFFLNVHKDIYEKEFINENNIDLDINYIVKPDLKSDFLIKEFKNVFDKFILFTKAIDILITKKINRIIQERNNLKNKDKSIFNDKNFEQYYNNQIRVFDYYKKYNVNLNYILKIMTHCFGNKIKVEDIKDVKNKTQSLLDLLKELKLCYKENKNIKEYDDLLEKIQMNDNLENEIKDNDSLINDCKNNSSIQNDLEYYFETLNNTNKVFDSYLKQINETEI